MNISSKVFLHQVPMQSLEETNTGSIIYVCFRYFAKLQLQSMGKINSPEVFQFAQDRVIAYNDAHDGNELAKLKQFPSGDYILHHCCC